jgi:gluconolactonase
VAFLVPFLASEHAAAQQEFGQPQGERQVTVAAIPGVVAAGAQWTLAWSGTDNADGLVGTPDGALLFAQEQPSRVSRINADGTLAIAVESTRGAGALAIDRQGRIIAAQRTCTDPGLKVPCSQPTMIGIVFPESERRMRAELTQGRALGRPNDLVVARNGGVYFTSGGAFHLSPRGQITSIGENLNTNGIMLSPDEKTLYVTNGPTIAAFDVQANGTVSNQRIFGRLEAGGSGDGMAIDATGRLYVTSPPGVQVFSPEGKHLGLIPTPRNVTSVAFAGRDRRTLYVVGSGALDSAGQEIRTAPGVRNNAKSIFRIPMLAEGFAGRAK